MLGTSSENKSENRDEMTPHDQFEAVFNKMVEKLTTSEKDHLKHMRWPMNTSYMWKEGFFRHLAEKKLNVLNTLGVKQLLVELKTDLPKWIPSDKKNGPQGKHLEEFHKKLAEKMLDVYWKYPEVMRPKGGSSEVRESYEGKGASGSMEQIRDGLSWQKIKNIVSNLRRQVFELVGLRDPWFDYKRLQKGQTEIAAKAGVTESATPAATASKVVTPVEMPETEPLSSKLSPYEPSKEKASDQQAIAANDVEIEKNSAEDKDSNSGDQGMKLAA